MPDPMLPPDSPESAPLDPFDAPAGAAGVDLAEPPPAPAVHPRREWAWIGLAILLQFGVLFGLIVKSLVPTLGAREILVQVVPVDPRDLMRGDYVILSYEFSRIPFNTTIWGLTELPRDQWAGKTVYISLMPGADDVHCTMHTFSATLPSGPAPFLRGTVDAAGNVQYGIESYYVQEGGGHVYEDAVRNRKLWARVAVAPNGAARLKGLEIE